MGFPPVCRGRTIGGQEVSEPSDDMIADGDAGNNKDADVSDDRAADTGPDKGTDTGLTIKRAGFDYLERVVTLDAEITGQPKPDYWQDIFERYASRHVEERFLLIAEEPDSLDDGIVGLIVGEVRGWEFGSKPCGWIFAISVHPDHRQKGIGEALFKSICDEFRHIGIDTVRTMVQREDPLHMAFFRSEGMVAGPYTQFEMSLED